MPASKSRVASNALAALRSKRRLKAISSQGGMTEVLLVSVIARGVSVAAARRALDTVKAAVVNWNELRVTQPTEVAAFLRGVRDASAKATAIHEVLSSIFEQTHDLEFQFLEGASTAEARDFLRGLGALTDDIVDEIVLAGRPHFNIAVDSDVLRVVRRLGLAAASDSVAKCQHALEELLGPEKAYQFVYLARELAENLCAAHSPKCVECALVVMCPNSRKSRSR